MTRIFCCYYVNLKKNSITAPNLTHMGYSDQTASFILSSSYPEQKLTRKDNRIHPSNALYKIKTPHHICSMIISRQYFKNVRYEYLGRSSCFTLQKKSKQSPNTFLSLYQFSSLFTHFQTREIEVILLMNMRTGTNIHASCPDVQQSSFTTVRNIPVH